MLKEIKMPPQKRSVAYVVEVPAQAHDDKSEPECMPDSAKHSNPLSYFSDDEIREEYIRRKLFMPTDSSMTTLEQAESTILK